MNLRSLRLFLLGAAFAITLAWAVDSWRTGIDGLDTAIRAGLVALLCVGALYTLLRGRRRAAQVDDQPRPRAGRPARRGR